MSVLQFVSGQYEEAHASACTAQKSADAIAGSGRRGLLARALGLQATSLGLAGRLAEARPAADLALPHAEAYGDQELLVNILSVLREHARRSGRLAEAASTGQRALRLAEHAGDPTAVAFERANLAELHLLLMEFDAAREHAEAAVRDTGERDEWCTPYTLAALARVRVRTGEPGSSQLLARAAEVAAAQADRQAMHEVRTAQAELLIREGRPEETLPLLADGTGPGAAHLRAWAELLSGHPDLAAHRAAAETGPRGTHRRTPRGDGGPRGARRRTHGPGAGTGSRGGVRQIRSPLRRTPLPGRRTQGRAGPRSALRLMAASARRAASTRHRHLRALSAAGEHRAGRGTVTGVTHLASSRSARRVAAPLLRGVRGGGEIERRRPCRVRLGAHPDERQEAPCWKPW
ncbi:hypothetical protein ACIQM4_25305 [Streptomyces sp. NPDC091272]|uniref:hypothetical protein n=1 Tax=Streptomyces sp. NPDC091272 TaxID=3365981 RepID=UPI00382604BF